MGNAKAILDAYKLVADASWPKLHPAMGDRSRRWSATGDEELGRELAGYVEEASTPDCAVRLFWKLAPTYAFGGCNAQFARDAGIPAREMIGLTDFDRRIPWRTQAAKYRTDDERVVATGQADLDIVERQESSTGITWVCAGKAPIRQADGTVIGVLGMYEILDADAGRKAFGEQLKKQRQP